MKCPKCKKVMVTLFEDGIRIEECRHCGARVLDPEKKSKAEISEDGNTEALDTVLDLLGSVIDVLHND